jgi:hypothetical protein
MHADPDMTGAELIRVRLVALVEEILVRYDAGKLSGEPDHPGVVIEKWAGQDLPALTVGDAEAISALIEALIRIETGTFGVCRVCGNAVEFQRLFDSPTTESCESCARDEPWSPSPSFG